jgi:hypothetical protein
VYMGIDLTRSMTDGSVKNARFPGLSMELYKDVGVKIKYKQDTAIVPWSNITVAVGVDDIPVTKPTETVAPKQQGFKNN